MAQPTRVTLQKAVSIQPLTDEQIEHYIQSTKGQLEELQRALRHGSTLAELAQRPLMLSIFTLAYQGAVSENLPTEGIGEEQQSLIFATYVEKMFNRRSVSRRFPHDQMLRWLTFLAARMRQHHQTVLYLEYMQPDWLMIPHRRLVYCLSIGLFAGLIGGLIFGLLFAPLARPSGELIFGLLFGLLAGLFVGLRFGLSQIQPKEMFTWSWKITKEGIVSILGGLASAGGVVVIFFILGLGYVFIAIGVILFVLLLGLSISEFTMDLLDDRARLIPNEGTWRSIQNGLRIGLFTGVSGGLIIGLLVGLLFAPLTGLFVGLLVGLLVALLVGLLGGLGAFFQHFVLRFWFWHTDSFPWNLVAFLDEAAERLLLRKVGGGYIFIHRLLLDHFASLEQKES